MSGNGPLCCNVAIAFRWAEGRYDRVPAVMSLYEVSDIVVGESFLARDLVRGGEPVPVFERSATRSLSQWDRIAARVVTVASLLIKWDGQPGSSISDQPF